MISMSCTGCPWSFKDCMTACTAAQWLTCSSCHLVHSSPVAATKCAWSITDGNQHGTWQSTWQSTWHILHSTGRPQPCQRGTQSACCSGHHRHWAAVRDRRRGSLRHCTSQQHNIHRRSAWQWAWASRAAAGWVRGVNGRVTLARGAAAGEVGLQVSCLHHHGCS
jgi:hypothetical protein